MKNYVSEEDFQQVLKLLDLPGETLSIEIGPRDQWPMVGIDSRWALRAVIGDRYREGEPYTTRTVYVPVMIPGDDDRRQRTQDEANRVRDERRYGRSVERVTLPSEPVVTYPVDIDSWVSCGRDEPHDAHPFDPSFPENVYPRVACPGLVRVSFVPRDAELG